MIVRLLKEKTCTYRPASRCNLWVRGTWNPGVHLHLQAGFEVHVVGSGCTESRSISAPTGRLRGAFSGSEVHVFSASRQIMTTTGQRTVDYDNL